MAWTVSAVARPRVTPRAVVRLRAYDLMRRAVEDGTRYGLNRAHKHTSKPSREHVEECVVDAVMGALDEVIDFAAGEVEP